MIYKNFISYQEHKNLKEWVQFKKFIKCEGNNKAKFTTCHLTEFDYNNNLIKTILSKINPYINNLKLVKQHSFILKVQENGDVFKHSDEVTSKLRFIILINKPEQGGILKIQDEEILMEETDALLFDATVEHELTQVLKNKEYLILVFSFN